MVVAGTVLLIVTGAAAAWNMARANWTHALSQPEPVEPDETP